MSQTRKAKGTVWIGTSGWVYKHWRNGVFYPKGLAANQQLEFYADIFKTVEINFSFYRLPERSVFESWRKQTPKGFLFAQTHMKKLNDPEESLERLEKRAAGLKEKLGPILFLAASWSYIRFHRGSRGVGFWKKELSLWAERIRAFSKKGADVFAYFNNDPKGFAIRDALRLREMLAGDVPVL